MDRKEAIEIIIKNYPHVSNSGSQFESALRELIPELAESEDERIRKKLFHTVLGTPSSNEWFEDISKDKVLAYLEKQKEQKTIQSKNEREYVRILKSIIADFIRDKKPEDVSFYQQIYDWLDGRHIEQQPAEWGEEDIKKIRSEEYTKGFNDAAFGGKLKEWSEEDRITIERIVETIQDYARETGQIDEVTCGTKEPLISYIRFLRSLRPQPLWKPSEEQMDWLESAVKLSIDKPHIHGIIISLYEQLKRL